MDKQIVVERDGIRITGPAKVRRNACIHVQANVMDFTGLPHDAWAASVDAAYSIYGAVAVEDNTVGQVSQVDGVDGSKRDLPCNGRRFGLTLNMYGFKVRDLNARLSALPCQS